MLLVVMGHITLTNQFQDPAFPLSAFIERTIYSFHMPLFMFISGFLFYLTKISRKKRYKEILRDKARRLLLPYCFFTFCTLLIKYAFNPLMKCPVTFSLEEFINVLTFKSNPLGEMWFVSTLFMLFLYFPVYKWTLKNKWIVFLTLIAGVLLNVYFPKDIDFLGVSKVAYFFLYFYTGILFSKLNLFTYLDNLLVSVIIFVLFIISIFFLPTLSIPVFCVFLGIVFSICLCIILSKHIPWLFQSFRNYTFQIFLMGIFFQMGVRFIYLKLNMEEVYWPLYILSILLALYIPVLIAKQIQKIHSQLLKQCFGL